MVLEEAAMLGQSPQVAGTGRITRGMAPMTNG